MFFYSTVYNFSQLWYDKTNDGTTPQESIMELEMYAVNDIPVVELLKNIDYSVDMFSMKTEQDWLEMMKFKSYDWSFWALCDEIPTRGFLAPIGIQVKPNGKWVLGNGHHRVAAAILLCLDSVKAYVSLDDAMNWRRTDPEGVNFDSEYDYSPIPKDHDTLWA